MATATTVTTEFETDWSLLEVNRIAAVHQYDCIVPGFEVWNTKYSNSKDSNGEFNRWVIWGPFAKLIELLEHINLMDNKIAVEYHNGIFIGFYDGKVTVGTRVHHFSDHPWIKRDVQRRYKEYKENRKAQSR